MDVRISDKAMADDQGGNRPVQPRQPGPVRRMTFSYNGDKIELVSEQHVQMILPPSQPVEQLDSLAGFHVVLRNQQDQAVYRATRTNPIRHDAEVFNEPGTERSVHRVPVERPKGTFVVLVPDVPGATALEFLGHPRSTAGMLLVDAPRQQSLARFNLKPFEGE